MTKLLIVGATGLVGRLVLERALADVRVTRVIALTRRPIPSRDKLQNVVADFSDLPSEGAWWDVDGVVCALGTTRAKTPLRADYRMIDYDYPLAVARHARNHGATSFALTSSLGADPRSAFVYTRTKGELEFELVKFGFPSLTIVRPSVLDGRRHRQRRDEGMAKTILRLLGPVLPHRLRLSPADAVAATLLNGAVEGPPGVHFKNNENLDDA